MSNPQIIPPYSLRAGQLRERVTHVLVNSNITNLLAPWTRRAAWCLVLGLWPWAAAAVPLTGVVKITTTTADGRTSPGSGFVVASEARDAYIVTATHVIAGCDLIQVAFASDPHHPRRGLTLEMDEHNDLAVLLVEDAPPRVTALALDLSGIQPRQPLSLVGFPGRSSSPLYSSTILSGRDGSLLMLDRSVAEGNSGGPVLRDGEVMGMMVENRDSHFAHAVSAAVVADTLDGWQIPHKISGRRAAAAPARSASASPALGSAPGPTALAETLPAGFPCQGKAAPRNGERVVVYAAPGYRFGMTGAQLRAGAEVQLLGKEGRTGTEWFAVPSGGWVYGRDLELAIDCP